MLQVARFCGSLKVTVFLLVAFLLVVFWGVLGQVSMGMDVGTERFFGSFFVWILDVIPVPAMKGLSVLASIHLVLSMIFRMPRGRRYVGLYGIHVALLLLLVGSLVGSGVQMRYNGYKNVTPESAPETSGMLTMFPAGDSLGTYARQLPLDDAGWAYHVEYRGRFPMSPKASIDLYTVTYDPMHFVPYAFMSLVLVSLVFHYVVVVARARKGDS
jgi:hypothetical protein